MWFAIGTTEMQVNVLKKHNSCELIDQKMFFFGGVDSLKGPKKGHLHCEGHEGEQSNNSPFVSPWPVQWVLCVAERIEVDQVFGKPIIIIILQPVWGCIAE